MSILGSELTTWNGEGKLLQEKWGSFNKKEERIPSMHVWAYVCVANGEKKNLLTKTVRCRS